MVSTTDKRCGALTAKGTACHSHVVAGSRRCAAHGGRRGGPVEHELVATVAEAAQTDWRAAAWILERRFPQRWRRGSDFDEPAAPTLDGLDDLVARREARRAAVRG